MMVFTTNCDNCAFNNLGQRSGLTTTEQQETSKFEKEMHYDNENTRVMFYAVPSLALASQN